MTTPADTCRAAAQKLRTLLADRELTPGPWLSIDRGDRVLWDGDGADDQPPIYVVNEPMSNGANADYLAALHPGVGTALANWLESWTGIDLRENAAMPEDARHALTIARQILGDTQ